MLNVAIYGMGNWGSRPIESVQGKSNKIKFVRGITRDPAAFCRRPSTWTTPHPCCSNSKPASPVISPQYS